MPRYIRPVLAGALLAVHVSCGSPTPSAPVRIGGSETLAPLTDAIAADFSKSHRGMSADMSSKGTVEGFVRFCAGSIDVVGASRPVTSAERAACESTHVSFVELPVGYDALTVIVNSGNTWATSITLAELRQLWEPAAQGKVTTWRQVRADWPDRRITLWGPGAQSGTFDYFTEAVTGKADASRTDYTANDDYKVIIDGVSADVEALGYVGYSYFDHDRKALKALAVDDGDDSIGPGAIEPSPESVARGIYRPFSRPLFIYINQERLSRPEVKAFAETYTRKAHDLARGTGVIPLTATADKATQERLTKGTPGTMFTSVDDAKLGIEILLTR